jgi:hypothetical protein
MYDRETARMASVMRQLKFPIKSFQFYPGVICGKSPMDCYCIVVAVIFPGQKSGLHGRHSGDSPVEALPFQNTELYFSHVEPASILGV